MFIIFICTPFVYSCEKREPEAQPIPNDIMKRILDDISKSSEVYEASESEKDAINADCIEYISGQKDKELSEKSLNILYSDEKQTDIDISKIEKYSVRQSIDNPSAEIGIFKLYDEVNAQYIKEMAINRIKKMREDYKDNIDFFETVNNAEARSYGNYVYYVSHSEKDKIFRIIENMLREKNTEA